MDVSGEYTFDAPQKLVWEALQDPDVLASVMPGGEGFEEVGENEYQGNLKIKVGPVQGKFTGNIKLLDLVAPESYRLEVDGKGAPGFVKATGGLKLTPQGAQTHMSYEGSAQVGGRIASVGQRLMDSSAKSIIRQSLDGLNAYLQTQVAMQQADELVGEGEEDGGETAVPPTTSPAPAYKPPSQTEVAMNVAKDVASDIIPPKYWPYVIGLVVLLIIILLVVIF
ncbi:MAG: carbon monoxide dehydrogenase subunit G [Ardenticatenaceae bacterium]|nr:carbon monoxide dehydrogenase subunit G [Anaerolineales bacterium]MCB8939703.1 carbon monoxide dehydrogenase subunit G [Ardenticatenaceae bacterium]MCB8975213.1 carbon monoxide dehydrogenase subunit G [Ardenticatenaceae bacterium]